MAAIGIIGGDLLPVLCWRWDWFGKSLSARFQQTSRFMTQVSSSDKNLSNRLPEQSKDEIGTLAKSINSFMGTAVSNSLEQVQDTSHKLNASANQLTSVAQITEQAASDPANETAEVQSNIEGIQAQQINVEQATPNRIRPYQSRRTLPVTKCEPGPWGKQRDKNLVSSIEEVKHGITTLNEQTGEVSSILSVIRGIADQTNLLALQCCNRSCEQVNKAEDLRSLRTRFATSPLEQRGHGRRIESGIHQFQQGSEESLTSTDRVCEQAHQSSTDIDALSIEMNSVVEEMKQVLAHAQGEHSTTDAIYYPGNQRCSAESRNHHIAR